jgi:hypothetical protein
VFARSTPDIVVWLSSWEKMNMLVGGHLGIAGTASGDALILSRMPQRSSVSP